MTTVNYVKLEDNAFEPTYAKPGDAGADLRAIYPVTIPAGKRGLIKLGLAIEIPEGYVGMVCPRSGLAINNGITVLNAPGIVDAGFRGEVGCILYNTNSIDFSIRSGDKIAQLVLVPFASAKFNRVEELSETERGEGGFGSTSMQ